MCMFNIHFRSKTNLSHSYLNFRTLKNMFCFGDVGKKLDEPYGLGKPVPMYLKHKNSFFKQLFK